MNLESSSLFRIFEFRNILFRKFTSAALFQLPVFTILNPADHQRRDFREEMMQPPNALFCVTPKTYHYYHYQCRPSMTQAIKFLRESWPNKHPSTSCEVFDFVNISWVTMTMKVKGVKEFGWGGEDMIPGCIRGPRSAQGSSDDVSKQTKSIVQVSREIEPKAIFRPVNCSNILSVI